MICDSRHLHWECTEGYINYYIQLITVYDVFDAVNYLIGALLTAQQVIFPFGVTRSFPCH